MAVILCENNYRLQWHIIQLCELTSFVKTTNNKDTVFIGPPSRYMLLCFSTGTVVRVMCWYN